MSESPQPVNVIKIVESYDSDIIVRRWGATWIDMLLLFAVAASLNIVLGPLWEYAEITIVAVVFFSYYLLVEGLTGWTLGKLVARIRVVDAHGGLPSFDKAIIRTVIRIFEVNPLLAGGVPAGVVAGLSAKKQRIGDMAAGTYVIKSFDLFPQENANCHQDKDL